MSTRGDRDGTPGAAAAASAVVLAGGASRRMGRDKRLLPWGTDADGRPRTLLQSVVDKLADVADDVIVVANDQPDIRGARVAPDAIPGSGSLGGILSGIEAARHERVFVAAADMPFLNVALVRDLLGRLEGHDAVVPVIGNRPEPLHAVYGPAVATAARRQIATRATQDRVGVRGTRCRLGAGGGASAVGPGAALVPQRQHAGGLRGGASGCGGVGSGQGSAANLRRPRPGERGRDDDITAKALTPFIRTLTCHSERSEESKAHVTSTRAAVLRIHHDEPSQNDLRRCYNNLVRRVYEHKRKLVPGFTSKYNLTWHGLL